MLHADPRYTVLAAGAEIVSELERRRSRFITVMRRVDSGEQAQQLVDRLRGEHRSARHHCSAWIIGPDRRVQRANDDGEPSGTAGEPMLQALSRTRMPSGAEDLSDVAAVVVRYFGGTLLGAGGLISAYSDSVTAALEAARAQGLLRVRRRMVHYRLPAPIAQVGRWENELRHSGFAVISADYTSRPGSALLQVAAADEASRAEQLHTLVLQLSGGSVQPRPGPVDYVDDPV
ncbi:YigZ family protein [Nesterenkonia sp.]|uniref:IMPACT family protein n=1 Tax=Nesterenkonia sp. TaxID=704201 RepID=UPI0026256C4C|nr:YigZ family protein [Nesterenkonia sp.]